MAHVLVQSKLESVPVATVRPADISYYFRERRSLTWLAGHVATGYSVWEFVWFPLFLFPSTDWALPSKLSVVVVVVLFFHAIAYLDSCQTIIQLWTLHIHKQKN